MKKIIILIIVLSVSLTTYSQNFELQSKETVDGEAKHSIVFSGFVNSIFYYDFVGINDAYPALNIVTVPVGDVVKEPYANFNAFQTRLRFNSTHKTKLGDLKLYVEGDFVSGTGAFRLRHALISLNRWDAGQTWSNFADEDAWPNTSDYDGPPTGIWPRSTMIRFHAIQGDTHDLAFSMEAPSLDYEVNYDIDSTFTTTNQNIPDFTVRYRYVKEKYHIQLGAVYRNIRYKNKATNELFYETGFGISASTSITILKRDKFYFQATIGKGIARYLVGFEERNWDAISVGTNQIELLPTAGGFIGYDHFWNKKKSFSSTLVLGFLYSKNDIESLSAYNDFMQGAWGTVNLYWYPITDLAIAVEYTGAYRMDHLSQEGYAGRVQLMVMYSF